MQTQQLFITEAKGQKRSFMGEEVRGKRGVQPVALREEVYRLDVTDRELMYDDSLASEWGRFSNYSPDDFE